MYLDPGRAAHPCGLPSIAHPDHGAARVARPRGRDPAAGARHHRRTVTDGPRTTPTTKETR